MLPVDVSAAINVHSRTLLDTDEELATVYRRMIQLDPEGKRFALVLRDTIDQLLNGEATGRYSWDQLRQTEKTHAGSMVEINLHREFDFDDGDATDYRIAGIEVDCKYSQQLGGWMIPPEAVGHICLLVWANDSMSKWCAGLMRIEEQFLNLGKNRDLKLTIKAAHRNRIFWLWYEAELPENVLLHLQPEVRDKILLPGKRKGQARVIRLFDLVQNKRIGRGAVRTAAQQLDYLARLREGQGRARTVLREKGILIAGPYGKHRDVAQRVGAEVPGRGEFVSFRVCEAKPHHGDRPRVELEGRSWVLANPTDLPEPGPKLPKVSGEEETAEM
ncbi:restriction endonuclease NaeI [Streptomyces alboflavus]|uniref:Restriction endonuclease NaeI n=1 Tax=Streptomyces alboflavus TaxID=67267 RepID=A0A1Z1WBE1_9ACTN|nr:NaeI family type II restriction endonuclease [Streptomyces alboflavus]ARX83753.1 restriction endonuclease NaeI [Streptomyces alboflavus]